ncbi:helix-turn-helix domain-containing protein [Vibrio kanaloae]|uniref:helix-turn-helix domain-containing protein n=1 Tax=Vibrio kanaloae TaxID=170673 RepID=UPI000C84C52B|nr:XRE family transcriptional regulator [Vibrio kanaloae]
MNENMSNNVNTEDRLNVMGSLNAEGRLKADEVSNAGEALSVQNNLNVKTELQVSQNLKRIRKEKGWSLDATAKATGVSKAMLGQIERGESSPTVAKLWQIATGFNVSFSSLILPSSNNELVSLFRDANILRDESLKDGFSVSVVFPFEPSVGFELYELRLAENYQHFSEPHSAGVTEHILCISGQMAVFFDDSWHELSSGQAVRFNAEQRHGYKNTGQEKAIFHNIIHYPNQWQRS